MKEVTILDRNPSSDYSLILIPKFESIGTVVLFMLEKLLRNDHFELKNT